LEEGIGQENDDTVLLRSFSAPGLASLAATNNEQAFLDADAFRDLLMAALVYLEEERDIRGWWRDHGWLHSTAHTADLLKQLAASPQLAQEDQETILLSIVDKLSRTNGYVYVYVWGEVDRLAAALLTLMAHQDFQVPAIESMLAAMAEVRMSGTFDPQVFAALQNHRNL
jgi:hypothetical protein